MKIICQQSELLAGVNTVLKAVPSKTTMPILECILIDTTEDSIKLTANDMELGIETIISGQVIEKGIVALDAKLFSEIIRKLPENEVTLETNENYQATITCEKAKFKIAGKSGDDFAALPDIQKKNPIVLSQFSLKEVIRQTIFSIDDRSSNKIMGGEYFEIEGNHFKVTTLDGHRISIRIVELKESYETIRAIVPGKTLNEVAKILPGGIEDSVNLYFTGSHIVFEFEQTEVVSRLIDGAYFDVKRMISRDYETKITLRKKDIQDCFERVLLLVHEGDRQPVIMRIHENFMELSMDTRMGSMKEEIDLSLEGKSELLIGFNPKYILDALRVIDDEEIDIYLTNSKAPAYIQNEDRSYVYVILPMNIRGGQA